LSLYGSTKLASETLALEYGETFRLSIRIVRCGLLTGAGQFGRADQGVVAYWIHSWALGNQLRYIGFGGRGEQVRDCLHPKDLTQLLLTQMELPGTLPVDRALCNAGGGSQNTMSLQQLSEWCSSRYGARDVLSDSQDRPMDVPWLVLDSTRASEMWGWYPETPLEKILVEIADFADRHPNWLAMSET
jgi:CDP-paratose 2-epimerase